jgi:glycosyltransferase involved in cell wall biosynthesis
LRIAVLNSCLPFVRGGAEYLADALAAKLIEFGHQAAVIKIPFRWYPSEKVLDHILACQSMRLPNVDRAIGLKFPAYFVPHPNKVLWLLHQFRQAYDLWGTQYQDIPATPQGLRIREVIVQSDNNLLRHVPKIYTNSHVVSERLKRFNGIDSEVLYPPLLEPQRYQCSEYGDYVFYPSRITGGKRQYLVAESMKYVRSKVRLVIAGSPETPGDLARIESIVRENGLEGRIEVLPRFISEDEKVALFSRALGCVYTPYDEDSYGYVTLEAYQSRKPVVTCSDSGGTSILVQNQATGYVSEPSAQAIGQALDRLFQDKARARRMGEAGYERMQALGLSWDQVIDRLTR